MDAIPMPAGWCGQWPGHRAVSKAAKSSWLSINFQHTAAANGKAEAAWHEQQTYPCRNGKALWWWWGYESPGPATLSLGCLQLVQAWSARVQETMEPTCVSFWLMLLGLESSAVLPPPKWPWSTSPWLRFPVARIGLISLRCCLLSREGFHFAEAPPALPLIFLWGKSSPGHREMGLVCLERAPDHVWEVKHQLRAGEKSSCTEVSIVEGRWCQKGSLNQWDLCTGCRHLFAESRPETTCSGLEGDSALTGNYSEVTLG